MEGRPSTSRKPLIRDTDPGGNSSNLGKTRLSLILVHCSLRSNFYIIVHPTPKQPSPSHVFTPLPPGRLAEINEFIQDLIVKGEDLTSIRIQLETQWPQHEEAIGQMVENMGVDKIDSEGIMNEYGGLPVPDMETLDIPLSGLCLNTDDTTAGDGKMVATTKVGSTT